MFQTYKRELRMVELKVSVRTPTRLHFGVLDPTGESDRRYGGIGVAVKGAGFRIEVEKNDSLEIDAPQEHEKRIERIAEDLSQIYDIPFGVRVRITQDIRSHVGLGSTTQLTLGLGKALTTLFEKKVSVIDLAKNLGRGKRSGVGTYAFQRGGFVVDGGGYKEKFPPLIFRHEIPEKWCFVVAVPDIGRGPEEEGEGKYFEGLESKSGISREVCFTLVMKLLPALMDQDIETFGEASTEIDMFVGKAFSPKQGGTFRGDEVSRTRNYLLENGAFGAGQSSWGPAVYGLTESYDQATDLKARVREYLKERSLLNEVMVVQPDNRGAEIKVE